MLGLRNKNPVCFFHSDVKKFLSLCLCDHVETGSPGKYSCNLCAHVHTCEQEWGEGRESERRGGEERREEREGRRKRRSEERDKIQKI